MAVVREFERKDLDRNSKHSEVDATISLVEDETGEKFIQIDTYGSKTRAIPGKVSQSLRLSKSAYDQLVSEGGKHF
ncbi:methionyl-tRNA formyltransferase [Aurantiacibacter zhengii]|uniref:Methionyl-tRNA formyltransferase n=1 Tax=Aurantiacibacter zhengii TaxID=2307003 RepID=A0A418NWF8_9SPHN|nr:methionyl-tRNA formyltransferase [Aurantiacibacter zhengii]RIV88932.1 methionyl-tRNA formyltransferase [Aurantiacibacter zhengii]